MVMDSPTSTTSSSDLYSNSEIVGNRFRSQSVQNGLSPRRVSQPPPEDSMPEFIRSRLSNTGQTTRGDREPSLQSSVGSTCGPAEFDGIIPDTSRKRKREQGSVQEGYLFNHRTYQDSDHIEAEPCSVGTSDFVSQTLPISKIAAPVDHCCREKRSKVDANGLRPFQNSLPSSMLPAELWQYIFCFVPPVSLGRLLRVNRAFNIFLTLPITHQSHTASPWRGLAKPLSANSIWAASRKRFCPGLPKPLRDIPELDMWRLLRGRDCQMCGKVPDVDLNSESPWESGPGERGVSVIWPFGIRCCGQCLQDHSEKEVNLLLSSSFPTFLLPALPFALISSSNHCIGNSALRSAVPPPTLQLTKHFYNPHIEALKRQLEDVKELGPASAEEWIKGLDGEGKERIHDTVRWEQWEAKGGLKKVNQRPHLKTIATIGTNNAALSTGNLKTDVQSERSTPQSILFPIRYNGEFGSPAPSTSLDSPYGAHNFTTSFQLPLIAAASFPDTTGQRSQIVFQQPRPERNIRDVNEAKAARRAEIERRCAALQPPLLPSVLSHMESFQAAIQISQPLTDQAWDVLKPRLLTQKPYAEKREQDRIQQSQIIQADYRQRRQQEAQLKETKETFDREWDNVQTPVRNRISALADERIERMWARGHSITKDTCPKFAADILIYARQRFYEDIDREAQAATTAGEPIKVDPPNGPPTRKLILENMKWLFDTKIKPLTEHFQKELFLCNGCDGNFKFYGFEGVIQHYAAKHTTMLSMGSVVVHWRAEWPEHPPFNSNPSIAKAAYYKVPTPAIASPQGQPLADQSLPTSYGGHGHNIDSAVVHQALNASHHSLEVYKPTFTGHQQDMAHVLSPIPPGPPLSNTNHYQGAQQISTVTVGFPGVANAHVRLQPTPYGHNIQAQNPSFLGYAHPSVPPSILQGPEQNLAPTHDLNSSASVHGGTSMVPRPNGLPNFKLPFNSFEPGRTFAPQAPDPHKIQMDTMARHARDVWFATAGIKDIPQSVRIHVVIQHTASRFAAQFTNEPSLAMFIDGIDHSSVMRPVRSLNGLACKTCVHTGAGIGERRLFTLPHLLNHFKNIHLENPHTPMNMPSPQRVPRLDWKTEMIELPEASLIANLINAAGMDDAKIDLIAWALPGFFPSPLPRMGAASSLGPVPIYRGDYARDSIGSIALPNVPSPSSVEPPSEARDHVEGRAYNRPSSGLRQLSQDTHLTEPSREDEYDPHRPAFLGKIVKHEFGPIQSRNASVSLPPRNGRQSAPGVPYDESTSAEARRRKPQHLAYKSAPGEEGFTNDRNDLRYERPEVFQPSTPRKEAHFPSSGGHRGEQEVARSIREAYENMRSYDGAAESSKRHIRVSDAGEAFENELDLERGTHSPNEGVVKAADQFLSSLGSGANNGLGPKPTPSKNGSAIEVASRRTEDPRGRCEEQRGNKSVDFYQWSGDNMNQDRKGNETPPDHVRAGSLAVQEKYPNPLQRPRSDAQYARENRSSSHIQIPLNGSKFDARLPAVYAPYQPPQPAVIYRPDVANDPALKPRSTGDSVQISHASRYRTRSRSPRADPIETAYYRARTPVEEARHEAVYRRRSPPSRNENRYYQVPSYDYAPQERYEYVPDRDDYEDPYRQRIEYVPMRIGEHSSLERRRYVLAQPLDSRPQPEFVRVERGYGEEPVYERHDQLFHESPRAYQVPGYEETPQSTHGYRY